MRLSDEQLDKPADNSFIKLVGNIIGFTCLVLVSILDDKESRNRARSIKG
jgi:hypothetical protein